MDRLARPGVLLGSIAEKFENENLMPVRASPLARTRRKEREHLHPLWALLASGDPAPDCLGLGRSKTAARRRRVNHLSLWHAQKFVDRMFTDC